MPEGRFQNDSALFYWLALERVPRVGPLTMARLFDAFGSPRVALEASAEEIKRRAGLNENVARAIAGSTPPEKDIAKDIELLGDLEARVVTRWDEGYPPNLLEIYDPPAFLFIRGDLTEEDNRAVAMVGTRNPSRYGLEMAEKIAEDLARSGITIVSGLARGIDTACHTAALRAGRRTIGVLGCGIDVVYPRENKALIEEVARCGAVITEFRPGTAPLATNFYRRNRIVSGLSRGVVVVEAGKKSGSLITAHHGLDQNREVLAVPGNVMNIRSKGPHLLIKEGAALVESAEDVIQSVFASAEPVKQATIFEVKDGPEDLSEDARAVLDGIDLDPIPIDALCQSLEMEAGRLSGILLELERRGLIRQHPGKMFARVVH
jgi:DNA processing protein